MPPTTSSPVQTGPPVTDPTPSRQFVHGGMTHQQKREFLFSDDRVNRLRNLHPDQKARLSRLLEAPKLEMTAMPDLIRGLSEIAFHAGAEISAACYDGDPGALTGNTPAHWDIKELILEEIVNRSHHFPPEALTESTEAQNREWEQTTLQMLFELLEDGNWEMIPQTLLGIDLAARNHNQLRGFPPSHTMRETVNHYSDPETRARTPGGNATNPSPPEPDGPPSEVAAYIGSRAAANDRSEEPQEPLAFLMNMLRPYLDQELLDEFDQGNPPQDGCAHHHPVEPHTTRGLRGPSNQPLTHMRTTYRTILRYNVANTGMIQAVSISDHPAAAAALRRIVEDMDAASDYLRDHVPDTGLDTAYQSDRSLRWHTGEAKAWRTAHHETRAFTNTRPLGRKILIATHELQQLHHRLTQHPDPPATALATLAEAAADLRRATAALDLIEEHRQADQERNQLVNDLISPAQRRFDNGDQSPSLSAMLTSYEQQQATQALAHMTRQHLYHEPASQALAEMQDAGLPPGTLHACSENHRQTALFDHALRALLHVDYVLHTTAHLLA